MLGSTCLSPGVTSGHHILTFSFWSLRSVLLSFGCFQHCLSVVFCCIWAEVSLVVKKTVSMQEVKPALPIKSDVSLPCVCQGSVTVHFAKGPFGFSWDIMCLQLLHKYLSTLKPVLVYRLIYSFNSLQILLQVPCCITEVCLKVSEVSQGHVQNEKNYWKLCNFSFMSASLGSKWQ